MVEPVGNAVIESDVVAVILGQKVVNISPMKIFFMRFGLD